MNLDLNDDRPVAQIFNSAIENSKDVTQREIAEHAGLNKPNIVYMFKTGLTKIPLDKAGKIVSKLDINESDFWFKCFKEYMPAAFEEFERVTKQPVLSSKEIQLIKAIRKNKADINSLIESLA